jgi:hypothetical protein
MLERTESVDDLHKQNQKNQHLFCIFPASATTAGEQDARAAASYSRVCIGRIPVSVDLVRFSIFLFHFFLPDN